MHAITYTREALARIAHGTLENVARFEQGELVRNEVRSEDGFR